MSLTIYIAAEDRLGIATLERIIRSEIKNCEIQRILPSVRLSGNQPLRQRVQNFRKAALAGCYYIVLTDLDDGACPLELLEQWGVLPLPVNLLFRVAVREIEAWLLGDRSNMSKLLGIKPALVNAYPEQLLDPKAELIKLASKGNAKIRKQLLPEKGAFGKIGPSYNDVLSAFIDTQWDYRSASLNVPSLHRFLGRLSNFATK